MAKKKNNYFSSTSSFQFGVKIIKYYLLFLLYSCCNESFTQCTKKTKILKLI